MFIVSLIINNVVWFLYVVAGTFKTGSTAANGSKISVGTMLMIEVNNHFRT